MRTHLPIKIINSTDHPLSNAEGGPSRPPTTVINGVVYFNGKCDECRPSCGAICCRSYGYVTLTEEEALSGRFAYAEVSQDCDCDNCTKARERGIRYYLRKQPDGSCIYLNGENRCSIYADRPQVCQGYSCVHIGWSLVLK